MFSLEERSKSNIFPTLIIHTMFLIHFNSCLLFFSAFPEFLLLSSYLFPLLLFLFHLFQHGLHPSFPEVSITALFHSPPLQSNSRSFVYALVFLLFSPRALFFLNKCFPISPLHEVHSVHRLCLSSPCALSLSPCLSDFFGISCMPITHRSVY